MFRPHFVSITTLLTFFMLILLLGASIFTAQAAPPQQGPLPIKDQELARIGRDLAALHEKYEAHRKTGSLEPFTHDNLLVRVSDDRVVIDAIAATDASALRADLEALGLQQAVTFGRMISGWLPISAIKAMAALDNLQFARPAYVITHAGSVTSQGDAAMGSDLVRTTFGVDGSGVTVGTLSDSYNCLGGAAGDVGTGDLPPGINVLDDTVCPGKDEGRAMMQLIVDVAPGASQAFHTAFKGQADFASGIIELATVAGADVVVDDVLYLAEPMFQDGIIAQAVDTVEAMGVAYFSSAGNRGRQSYESPYAPSGLAPFASTKNLHDFDPGPGVDIYQNVTIPAGATVIFALQWDQPFFSVSGPPGSSSDLDIFLLDDPPTTVLASGVEFNVGDDPVEIFSFTNPVMATSYNIMIDKIEGPDPGLMKYVYFGSMTINEFDTASSTLYGHANAAGAEAVGAAFYGNTPAFGTDPALLEPFSSAGPTPILFETDGTSTFEVRAKPEIVCPDGANTTFFGGFDFEPDGFPNFFGTSAAAPHAAGVAALMSEATPSLTPAAIYSTLESTAADIGPPGFDNDSGFGFCQADGIIMPNLTLIKTVDQPGPNPGSLITYTIVVSNSSHVIDATGALISDTLPMSITLAGPVTLDPFQAGAILATSDLGLPTLADNVTITANTSITLTFPVTVDITVSNGTQLINTAAVTSPQVTIPVKNTAIINVGGLDNIHLPIIIKGSGG